MLCSHCDKEFKYLKKEHTRRVKAGKTKFYCSRSCSMKANNCNMSPERRAALSKNFGDPLTGNTFGKKGDFTIYLRRAKAKLLEFDLDDHYLQSIWTGKCALSGINVKTKTVQTPTTASLDRIDSKLGYVKGNVQFVAYALNLAKNTFGDEEIRTFISELKAFTLPRSSGHTRVPLRP